VTGDAEGREAVQDRLLVSGFRGDRRLGMQRVVIAGEPVDQRRLGPCWQVADDVGRAVWNRVGRRARFLRPAESAIGAAERRMRQRCERRAGLGIRDRSLGVDDRALARAFVDDVEHARFGAHAPGGGQGTMQFELLFAVHDLEIVDAGIHLAHPRPVGEHAAECRQRLEALLVHEREFRLAQRIVAEPQAEGVQDRVARAVALLDRRNVEGDELVVVDGHRML
jgi:hypothetical protein